MNLRETESSKRQTHRGSQQVSKIISDTSHITLDFERELMASISESSNNIINICPYNNNESITAMITEKCGVVTSAVFM